MINNERERQEQSASDITNSNVFTKAEFENVISTLSKISYIFMSQKLVGDHNQTMMSITHSYIGILGYFYEVEYKYGKMTDIVDNEIAHRCIIIKLLMLNNATIKNGIVVRLAKNWSDVLQVINNLQFDSNTAGNQLKNMESDIEKVTAIFEKLSGCKCRKPKDPQQQTTQRSVTYNPYNITEDTDRSSGHHIPDITFVFAKELFPQLFLAKFTIEPLKDIVANYAIGLIKTYYENAGFVPMIIVDQITGQINQVVERVEHVSYAPQSTLKEYVLNKIYK